MFFEVELKCDHKIIVLIEIYNLSEKGNIGHGSSHHYGSMCGQWATKVEEAAHSFVDAFNEELLNYPMNASIFE